MEIRKYSIGFFVYLVIVVILAFLFARKFYHAKHSFLKEDFKIEALSAARWKIIEEGKFKESFFSFVPQKRKPHPLFRLFAIAERGETQLGLATFSPLSFKRGFAVRVKMALGDLKGINPSKFKLIVHYGTAVSDQAHILSIEPDSRDPLNDRMEMWEFQAKKRGLVSRVPVPVRRHPLLHTLEFIVTEEKREFVAEGKKVFAEARRSVFPKIAFFTFVSEPELPHFPTEVFLSEIKISSW